MSFSCESMLPGWNLKRTWSMEDILKRWTEHLERAWSGVSHPPPVNCDFCGGEHFNNNCHLYSMENSWWGQELHLYNQHKKKDFLIWRMCLCNSWKHPKLALKSIKTQCRIKKFRLARVTPWKIVSGRKSYNPIINMNKKEVLILTICWCKSRKHMNLLNTQLKIWKFNLVS